MSVIKGRSWRASELRAVSAKAAECTRCDLYRNATQTVFGEGPAPAPVMLVGEQPGDREDQEGEPFVGPAGRVLDQALASVGIDRDRLYITNAVKHFKWEPRGKRRIHQRPSASEVTACHGWLDEELKRVDPEVVVALGAVAVRALFGKPSAVGELRGQVHEWDGRLLVVTVHPASIVRLRDAEDRGRALEEFAADLSLAFEAARSR
jgi:uracil-DNA glycosylase family protein